MSVLPVLDGPPPIALALYQLGQSVPRLLKTADDAEVAYNLAGMLYLSSSGWLCLAVPNPLVRGIFSAMHEPGIELPPSGPSGHLEAHISVMHPKELTLLGGAERVSERGKTFHYTLGRLMQVEPLGWPDMDAVWFVRVHSQELQDLRRSYGLSSLPAEGAKPFHITVAVRRRGILGRNEKAKGDAAPAVH